MCRQSVDGVAERTHQAFHGCVAVEHITHKDFLTGKQSFALDFIHKNTGKPQALSVVPHDDAEFTFSRTACNVPAGNGAKLLCATLIGFDDNKTPHPLEVFLRYGAHDIAASGAALDSFDILNGGGGDCKVRKASGRRERRIVKRNGCTKNHDAVFEGNEGLNSEFTDSWDCLCNIRKPAER